MVGFAWEEVIVHYLPADEALEGEGSQHVEAEAESGDLHNDRPVDGEVVEDVASGEGAEGEEPGEGHGEASEEGDERAVMRDGGEAVHCWGSEGAVDEEGVVMADECEGDDSNGLKEAVVDEERFVDVAS